MAEIETRSFKLEGTDITLLTGDKYVPFNINVYLDTSNILAENIRVGKTIFGVTGTFTSDANATASSILSGKTAYVNGNKITGTMGNATFSTTDGTATLTVSENTSAISGATNISSVVANPTTTKPSSGYIYAFNIASEGIGSVSSNSAGYVNGNSKISDVTVSKAATTYYSKINAAEGTVTNGTATNAKATASIRNSQTGDILKLGTTNSGLSTTEPTGKVAGTEYWVIAPTVSSTTAGSVSAATATISSAGYAPSGTLATGSSVSVGVTGSGGTKYYLSKASGSITNGTATKATATASIRNSSGDLINLGTSNTGLSTSAPSGTAGTDYWTIQPSISSSAGSVSAASATISSAGYAPSGTLATGSSVSVGVTESTGSAYYLSKATFANTSISSPTITATENTTSISNASNLKDYITILTNKPTSGNFYAVDIGVSGSVTNKSTKAGYIPANANINTTSVSGKKTVYISPNSASSFSLSITDKASTDITVGTVYTDSDKKTYYPLSASLTGTLSASNQGWFSSGSATDSSVTVGRVKQSTVGDAAKNTTDSAARELDPGKQVVISAGYYPTNRIIRATIADAEGEAVNVGSAIFSVTDNDNTSLSAEYHTGLDHYDIYAGVSGQVTFSSAGWMPTTGVAVTDTRAKVGSLAKALGSITNGTATKAKATASIRNAAGDLINLGTSETGISTSAPTGTAGTDYWVIAPTVSSTTAGSVSAAKAKITTAGYTPTNDSFATGSSVSVGVTGSTGSTYYVNKSTITAGSPSTSVTHGAVTPSVGGTVTGTATTTKPSGTDGTDYLTINPGASIATQPKVTPSYTYSATAGYTPAVGSTTKTGSSTNVTPAINAGTNYYLPKKNPKFDGGGLSGGGLSATTNYVGTPTVSVANGSDTNMANITVGAKAQSGYPYYFKVSGSTSKLTGSTTVTRAKTTRAAVLYNGAVDGWVKVADNATASSAVEMASTTCNASVTVNAGSGSTYVGLKEATCTIAGGGLSKGNASGGGLSGGGLTQSGNSGGGLSSSSSNVTLSDTNNGISVTVTRAVFENTVTRAKVNRAAFSQTVTRAAVTDAHTAGYLPAKTAATAIASASETVSLSAGSLDATTSKVSLGSGSITKYITGVTVPSGKTFSVTNNGTTSFGSNNGAITVTSNTDNGTIQYVDWKMHRNNSNKSLEFIYTE